MVRHYDYIEIVQRWRWMVRPNRYYGFNGRRKSYTNKLKYTHSNIMTNLHINKLTNGQCK